jgi:ferredoxin-fold anticodon binding domain-containing protein
VCTRIKIGLVDRRKSRVSTPIKNQKDMKIIIFRVWVLQKMVDWGILNLFEKICVPVTQL